MRRVHRQIFEYHPVLGYRFIPNIKARVPHESGGYLIRTNNMGFRCQHDFSLEKSKAKRVLLFGDSYTAGDGVSNKKRYGDVLETLLPEVEIYNFGLPGTGTDQQYLSFQEFGQKLDYDLIIISVMVENIRRITAPYRYYENEKGEMVCFAKPYFSLKHGELELNQVPPEKLPIDENSLPKNERNSIDRVGRFPRLRKMLIKTNTEKLAHRLTGWKPYRQYESAQDPAWKLMQAILEKWINVDPNKIILVPMPMYYFIEELSDPSDYQARYCEVAQKTGCTFHDPLPDLLKSSIKERRNFRFKMDVHFTPRGHEEIAKSLLPTVKTALGLS